MIIFIRIKENRWVGLSFLFINKYMQFWIWHKAWQFLFIITLTCNYIFNLSVYIYELNAKSFHNSHQYLFRNYGRNTIFDKLMKMWLWYHFWHLQISAGFEWHKTNDDVMERIHNIIKDILDFRQKFVQVLNNEYIIPIRVLCNK